MTSARDIHEACRAAGVGHRLMCRRAGVDYSLYKRYVSGRHVAPPRRIVALRVALDALIREQAAAHQNVRAGCAIAAVQMAQTGDIAARRAAVHATGKAMLAAAPRSAAYYVANTVLGMPQSRVARLFDVSKQAVHKAVPKIEDQREQNPALDRLLTLMEEISAS